MTPTPKYIAYIDEGGDPGVRPKPNVEPWTEWFTFGAVVVSADRDADVPDWVRDMREATRSRQRRDLHYRNLSAQNKSRVCRMLATKEVRLFVVASHKANFRVHHNLKLGTPDSQIFYNFCLRWLLERVTGWCGRRSLLACGEVEPIKLIFSSKGDHNYPALFKYLRKLDHQARTDTAVLNARNVVPGTIRPDLCQVRAHDEVAGLQLADVVASAFFQAANSALPTFDLAPAKLLKPRLAREGTNKSPGNFGVSLLPLPSHGRLLIPEADRAIFRHYGFKFEK